MTALALIVFVACEHVTDRQFTGLAKFGSVIALIAASCTDALLVALANEAMK